MDQIHSSPKFSRTLVLWAALLATAANAQIAKGATKYLGNITTNGAVRSDFVTYWNQITAENECKWGSVQGTSQSKWSWSGCDDVYKYAKNNGIPFKFHTLIWGSQLPSWLSSLSTTAQTAAITAWMDSAAAHYPDADLIDVVNEATPGHAPFPDSLALGGKGTSGYDWVIKAFTMARARWPKAKLILNDYNNIRWNQDQYITLAKAVVNSTNGKKIIDGVGCQAHDLGGNGSYMDSSAVASSLKTLYTSVGLPIYVSEFDLADTISDASQLAGYKKTFPPIWQSPYVAGVTLWGYISGATWITGSGLISSGGTARSAFTWLQSYVKSNLSPTNPTTSIEADPNAETPVSKSGLVTRNVGGHLVLGVERNGQFQEISATGRK
jgi:GH35 family endo-1,4-beta-xylanase